jgi:hypothetical protein
VLGIRQEVLVIGGKVVSGKMLDGRGKSWFLGLELEKKLMPKTHSG